MYIEPNSTIKLLKNVPLDMNQTDTLYFSNLSSQLSYYNNKVSRSFSAQTYQRVNRNTCRLQVKSDLIYDVNYMMFQNTSYSNKWFYAFVTSVEYVNDNTTEVTYELDPLQSWFFDYEIGECFVEREHTASDNIGEHIEPEGIEVGEYVLNVNKYNAYDIIGDSLMERVIVVAYNNNDTESQYMYGGVYSGVELKAFDAEYNYGIPALREFLTSLQEAPEQVLNMYMLPFALTTFNRSATPHLTGQRITTASNGYQKLVNLPAITTNDTLDGYKPKNNKLYTYPYNYYHIDNNNGSSLACRYEFFDTLQPRFRVRGCVNMPVELTCTPYNYKNCKTNTAESSGTLIPQSYRVEHLAIKGFPMCNWDTDYFAAWLAQNSVPMIVQGFKTAVTSTMIAATGNPVGAVANVLNTAGDMLSEAYTASIHADITSGSIMTGNVDYSANELMFKGCRMSITHQYAKRIDDYFTMFGYAVGVIKQPSRYSRTRYTYTKTAGANVHGNLPSKDAKIIADIYNKGIRFWADHNNINNYSNANLPLS